MRHANHRAKWAALVAALLISGGAVFDVALALTGHLAGFTSSRDHVAVVGVSLLHVAGAIILLGRVGYLTWPKFGVYRIGSWIVVAWLALGVLAADAASTENWQRFLFMGLQIVAAILAFIVARSPSPWASVDGPAPLA
jgi:hypothetical protein